MNENCSRIRHYSENDTADATGPLLPSSGPDTNQTCAQKNNVDASDGRHGLKNNNQLHEFNSVQSGSGNYYSSNNHLIGMHNDQHLGDNQALIDEYANRIAGDNNFEDEDGMSKSLVKNLLVYFVRLKLLDFLRILLEF